MERLINIYILNLLEREDRLNEIKKRVNKLMIPRKFSLELIEVRSKKSNSNKNCLKDWTLFNEEDLRKVSKGACVEKIKKWWSRKVTEGEEGCFEAHIKAIKMVNKSPAELNLIMEDDADFSDDLLIKSKRLHREIKANKKNWHMLFLGNSSNMDFYKKISRNIEEYSYSYKTHAYLINKSNSKDILNIDYSEKIIPYDEFISACALSHPRVEINKLYTNRQTKINCYRSVKQLSWQNDINKKSDID